MKNHTKICTLFGAKPLRIRFDKIDRLIRIYDGSKYLVLSGLEKYDAIQNRIRYSVSQKSGITYVFPHYYTKIKVDSYYFLAIEYTTIIHSQKNVPINQLKNNDNNFFDIIIILRSCDTKVAKEKFYDANKTINIWDVNVDNIVISKLVETKTNSEYQIGYLDKVIIPLVLVLPKMSRYVQTFKVTDGDKTKSVN